MLKSIIHLLLGFSMKYADLVDPTNLHYAEETFNQILDETYTIRRTFFDRSHFISFLPKQWKNKHPKPIHTNWKARLSIHPEDLDKAWGLIYPILHENVTAFKVANSNVLQKSIVDRKKVLDDLLHCKILTEKDSNNLDHAFLKRSFYEVSQILDISTYSKWKLISLVQSYYTKLYSFLIGLFSNKDNLFIRTKQKYEQLLEQRKQKMISGVRFYEGMQFTIYIMPGTEQKAQLMLKEIEALLIREKIRTGVIYPTDRQIGIYSSIRHPGKATYHDAISVDSYNPDNIDDPFEFLETLQEDEIINENNCLKIINKNNCCAQNIIEALTTKKFISPRALKIFAEHKEEVVEHIKSLSLPMRKKIITESLNESTSLGCFFRVQRGFFKPKLGRGTLKQIEDLGCEHRI